MNKLITKIVGVCLGLTMAVGVGVAVSSKAKDFKPVEAAASSITFTTSASNLGYSSGTASNKSMTVSGVTITFSSITGKTNSPARVQAAKNSTITSTVFADSITSITLNDCAHTGTKSDGSFTVSCSANGSSWTEVYSTSTMSPSQGNVPITGIASGYKYFKVTVGNSRVLQLSGIVVNYGSDSTPLTGITLGGAASQNAMSIGSSDLTAKTVSVTLNPSGATDQKVNIAHQSGTSGLFTVSGSATCTSGSGSFTVTGKGNTSGSETFRISGNTQTSVYVDLVVTALDDSATYWTVSFDVDGGSASINNMEVEDGDTFEFPSPGTKDHHSFDGWSSDGGNTLYDAGDESPAVGDDIEYIAYWTEDAKYTVTYNAASPASGSYSHTNQYGGTYTLLAFASLSGITYDSSTYRFKNYTVGGVAKNPGDTFTLSSATTVTVNFEEKPLEYQVTFGTAEGTTGISDFSNTTIACPSEVTLDNIQGNVYGSTTNAKVALRFGKSGTTGSFDASITGNYYIVSVTCNLKYYGTDTTATFAVTPSGGSAISKSLTGDWAGYTYDVSAAKTKTVTLGTDVNGKRAFLSGFTIAYAAQPVLDSVTTSGQTTSFTQGGSFAYGGTLTAHYTQGKADATVTPNAYKIGESGFNPASAGTAITIGTTLSVDTHNGKYISVGYTEDDVTKWSALYQITVSYAAVSSLTLASNTGKVALNEYFDMSEIGVTILPSNANQEYEWTVLSNTVNDDYEFDADIVAAKDTEGTITLKCISTADSSKYQTFVLTVSGNPVVTLPNSVTLYTGKTTTVTASVEGGTSPYSYSWSITSGGSYASISSGGSSATVTLSGTAAGSVTLQCSVTDSNSKSDSAGVTFSVVASAVTSISWSASAFDVFTGATIPSNIDDTWEVNYEKNNGDADYITFGDYELYVGSKEITSLPYTFVAEDDGESLHVEYGGISSSSVAVTVTQRINDVMASSTSSWDYTFPSKQWSAAGSVTLDGKSWTMSGTDDGSPYFGYDDTKGQQFGSGSHPWSDISLQSSAFSGTVDSVTVYTSGANSINATVQVSVGGTAYGSAQTITNANAPYTFDLGGKSGTISIDWVNSSSKAIYVKEIVVNTVSGSSNIANSDDHKAAQRVAVKFANAFNAAMDDTENCTTGLDAAWSTCSAAYNTFKTEAAALGETEEAYAKNLIKYATITDSWPLEYPPEACIERMMRVYKVCVKTHGKTPFMNELVPLGANTNVGIMSIGSNSNTLAIVLVALSGISLTA